MLLVGNKADMASERVVTQERGQELANQLGMTFVDDEKTTIKRHFVGFDFFECSAKENLNVSAAFDRYGFVEERAKRQAIIAPFLQIGRCYLRKNGREFRRRCATGDTGNGESP